MKRQAGFSLIEMVLVLGILAIGATTVMRIANNKMEETITSRTVSELSIAAEAAYECFVSALCKDSENDNGWYFPRSEEDAGISVIEEFLPQSFPARYGFSEMTSDASALRPKAEIRVSMETAGRAQRVARAFGSQASHEGSDVVLTLGIPGTERAFSSAINKTKRAFSSAINKTKRAFSSAINKSKIDIERGIEEGGTLNQVTVGSATITEKAASALATIAGGLNCPWGIAVNSVGAVSCAQVRKICDYRGETLYSGQESVGTWLKRGEHISTTVGQTCNPGSRYPHRVSYVRTYKQYRMKWRCNAQGEVVKFPVGRGTISSGGGNPGC